MTTISFDIPRLETERLVLREWRESDLPAIQDITTDEEASRYIGGTTPPWQAFRTMCTFIGHWQVRGFGFFAVEEKSSKDCIGWAGCWRPDGWPENEIGYSFRRSVWGRGFATEAAKASLLFAYKSLGWETAISCIDEKNTGSRGVAQRLGATLEDQDVEVNFFRADIWRHLPPKEFLERHA